MALVTIMSAGFVSLAPAQIPRASAAIGIFEQLGGSLETAVLAVIPADHIAGRHAPAQVAVGVAAALWWALALTLLAVVPALQQPERTMVHD